MKFVRRFLALALALLMLVIPAMGCESYQQETKDSNTVAVIIDGEKIYMDEAKLYTYTAQYQLEDDYVFYILYYYGGYDAFWKADWSEALSTGAAQLYQTKVLCNYAKANNITLTAEELGKIDAAISDYRKDADAAITYSGASDELVKKFFTDNALANKVYCELIKDVDTNFDQATFTRKNVEGISVIALDEAPDETEEEIIDPELEEPDNETVGDDELGDYSGEEEFPGVDDEGNELTEAETSEEETTEPGGEGPVDDEDTLLLAGPNPEDMQVLGAEPDGSVLLGAENDAEDLASDTEETVEESGEETSEEETTEEEATEEETTEEETTVKETYSEETKTEKREAAVADIKARVEKGESMDDIVASYRGDKFVSVSKLSSNTVAPTDAVEAGKDKTSYKQDAWEMKTGDILTCTYEGEEGNDIGYVLHCVNDDDPDLRKEAEDAELSTRKVALFNEKYAEIQKKVKEFHVYEEKIASAVKYKGQIHDAMTIDGDDMEKFYETSSEEESESESETASASESAT